MNNHPPLHLRRRFRISGRRLGLSHPRSRAESGADAPASWFRSLVEHALVGIYLIQDGRFIYVNPKLAELFGYSQEEIVRHHHVVDLVVEEDRARVTANLRRRLHGEVSGLHYAFRGLRSDGTRIEVEAHGTVTEIAGVRTVIGTLLDVTRRKRAEEESARLLAEAQRAVQARDEVLAVVSHDLRNPLSAIDMAADLLLDTNPVLAHREALEALKRLTRQMNLLIQDLLDVSALEAGRLGVEPSPHEVAALMGAARELLEPLAAEKGLTLEVEVPGGLPHVRVDGDRIVQVFSNLVGNAIKFTPAGGRIRIHARRAAGEVVFSVGDTGPGIAPEHLPHVFDRFWRGYAAGRDGAGLGLAIVRGIVQAHGGEIWVESKPGAGSTFYFTLPAE